MTKVAMKEKAKKILNGTPYNTPLTGDDADFMFMLLSFHPQQKQKTGVGIQSLVVRKNPQYPNNTFYIIRKDGTETDFSYLECINTTPHYGKVLNAMRYAVSGQITDFKNQFFRENFCPSCPYRKTLMTPSNSHVDHEPPQTFERLAKEFFNEVIPSEQILIKKNEDNEHNDVFLDLSLEQSWQDFHQTYSRLRVISREANLSDVRLEAGNCEHECPHKYTVKLILCHYPNIKYIPQIREECGSCGKYIKFAVQTPELIEVINNKQFNIMLQ
jgi:hypothetical protein